MATRAKRTYPPTVSRSALLLGGSDRKFRDFLHALLTFSHQVRDVLGIFAEVMGVSSPQYELLINIRYLEDGEGVNITRLAAALHCSGAFVTTEVGKLVAAGLVDKRRDSHDRRCVVLRLTERCRARFEALAALQRPVNDALFGCLRAADLARLVEMAPALMDCGDRGRALARYLVRNPQSANAA
ncbi:MAG TPA: MarR family winged helix-turn-helix transcriptional regulator [Candidatus Binataceae bacterium]|nr:MarR family winged helix-turn-helix transcriptional regulator [Candidatus Binataceae bacterium]